MMLTQEVLTARPPNLIFVFGSNLAGRHGKGAAKFAKENCGAIYGWPVGRQGQSYAIPTKDENLKVLPLPRIRYFIIDFLMYAHNHPELRFQVTAIGTGLAGYAHWQIAPFFKWAPENCELPREWKECL